MGEKRFPYTLSRRRDKRPSLAVPGPRKRCFPAPGIRQRLPRRGWQLKKGGIGLKAAGVPFAARPLPPPNAGIAPSPAHGANGSTCPPARTGPPFPGAHGTSDDGSLIIALHQGLPRRARCKRKLFLGKVPLPTKGSARPRRQGKPPPLKALVFPLQREAAPPKRRKTANTPESALFLVKTERFAGKPSLRPLHGGAVWIKQHLHITPAPRGPRSKR